MLEFAVAFECSPGSHSKADRSFRRRHIRGIYRTQVYKLPSRLNYLSRTKKEGAPNVFGSGQRVGHDTQPRPDATPRHARWWGFGHHGQPALRIRQRELRRTRHERNAGRAACASPNRCISASPVGASNRLRIASSNAASSGPGWSARRETPSHPPQACEQNPAIRTLAQLGRLSLHISPHSFSRY